MAGHKKIDLSDPAAIRKLRGENQSTFWSRFGVTQSGGSRYETDRAIPKPTAILMALYLSGRIDDKALADICKAVSTKGKQLGRV